MLKRFVWQPGTGPDPEALDRLRTRFKRPKRPLGQGGLFGGERRFFDELMGDLDEVPVQTLQQALQDIASNTSCFGPDREGHEWYHHLLGQVLPRCHESHHSRAGSLLESLITAFIAFYPNGVYTPPYRKFHVDVLKTLGRCLMAPACWSGGDLVVGSVLRGPLPHPEPTWARWDASGDLSASLCFVLKYLPDTLLPEWWPSVLAITSPHWRAQLMAWLTGAHRLLTGQVQWPSEFTGDAHPTVDWAGSQGLRPDLAAQDISGASPMPALLPEPACRWVVSSVRAFFSDDVFIDWLESIAEEPRLAQALAEIPYSFEQLYLQPP